MAMSRQVARSANGAPSKPSRGGGLPTVASVGWSLSAPARQRAGALVRDRRAVPGRDGTRDGMGQGGVRSGVRPIPSLQSHGSASDIGANKPSRLQASQLHFLLPATLPDLLSPQPRLSTGCQLVSELSPCRHWAVTRGLNGRNCVQTQLRCTQHLVKHVPRPRARSQGTCPGLPVCILYTLFTDMCLPVCILYTLFTDMS